MSSKRRRRFNLRTVFSIIFLTFLPLNLNSQEIVEVFDSSQDHFLIQSRVYANHRSLIDTPLPGKDPALDASPPSPESAILKDPLLPPPPPEGNETPSPPRSGVPTQTPETPPAITPLPVPLAPAPSPSPPVSPGTTKKSPKVYMIVGIVGGVFTVSVALIIIFLILTRKIPIKPWTNSGQLRDDLITGKHTLQSSSLSFPLQPPPSLQLNMATYDIPGLSLTAKVEGAHQQILTKEALEFLVVLHRSFNSTRKSLLHRRQLLQAQFDAGALPDFLKETEHIRNDPTWQGPRPMPGLEDRRVEITGPVDRKMVINALNSGAATFMADFEDSNAPTWLNNLDGQVNLRDAVRRQIAFKGPNGKEYKLDEKIATLIVRARGWHLDETHVLVDGQPMSGSIFDFGLYFFHNAKELLARGFGPYFYLPKMEHYLEARLWNDIFRMAQDLIGVPRGSIRATVLIETITASFQMDEIIYELREHSSGLNCGRWDYIFSFIKKMRMHPDFVLPDRSHVTMTVPFMASYVRLLIKTCHKRGVAAIGGMAAQIPIKNDEAKNNAVMDKVKADKQRECDAGHDGTWVAHPGLVKIALDIFNKGMPGPNQYHIRREDVSVTALDLLNTNVPGGISEEGIRGNCMALLHYCANWVGGLGCVPVANLMEDAATAEISRSQLWHWVKHGASTQEGQKITIALVDKILDEETAKTKKSGLDGKRVDLCARYLKEQIRADRLSDFLTTDLTPHLDEYAAPTRPAKL